MVLKALNTLLNFKLYLIYTILILFWELNQNSIQIFHHIQSSCLHIQSSEEIETHSAEAIKSDLASIEEPNFNVDGCEALWSSLKIASRKTLYISSFYRPPNSSTEILDHLDDSLNNVFLRVPNHPNIIMGGDFNLGDIDWNQETPSTTNPTTASQHNKFMHILDDYSLSQHVKVPTRPAFEKTLDLLLSTYPNSVSHVFMSSGLSDHLAVIFEINLKPLRSTKPPHKAYIYKKANFDGLNDFISKSSSEFFASNPCGNSVEQNWNSFKHAVTTGISQFIPQKSSKPKFSLLWITPKIKREMHKKDRLHRRAVRTKDQHHWKAFKRQRNSVSNLIKDSHNSYLNDVIGDSLTENPKKFWSYVKHSRSENLGIPPLKTEQGVFVTDKDKAETLNSYFFSVFTNEQLPLPKIPISPYSSIVDLHTSPKGVAKQLSQLNPNNACAMP